jgi:hypothetical protein
LFDVFYKGKKPNLFAFELPADSLKDAAEQSRTKFFWFIDGRNDYTDFDFEWRPPPWEEVYVHCFPSQWQRTSGTYFANKWCINEPQWNFRTEQSVKRLPDSSSWIIPRHIDLKSVDISWHPDDIQPPYNYHFPSQWQSASGVVYLCEGATEIKLIDDFQVTALPSKDNWEIPEDIDESKIDFSWHPNHIDPPFIYHFPSEWQSSSGLIYKHPHGSRIRLEESAPTTQPKVAKPLSIFFIDKMNSQSAKRFESLKEKYPDIQKVRYMNSEIATITRCCQRSATQRFWVISSENLYDDFDFSWQPATWQRHMTHVFGSKWEKWSFTYQINKYEFERHTKWAKSINEFPNLNFVEDQMINVPIDKCDYYWLDWGNPANGFEELQSRLPKIKRTRVIGDYLSALKRIAETAQTEWVWITASVCDYSKFDFTWTPEPWQEQMLHCFPSSEQKRGDTFYMNVEEFRKQMNQLEILDWFKTINYCEDQNAPRWLLPIINHDDDSHVSSINLYDSNYPVTIFCTDNTKITDYPSMCLWREKDRTIIPLSKGATAIIIPKDVVGKIKTQLYDYPFIDVSNKSLLKDVQQDVIFISNGETMAEENWEKLKKQFPNAKRSDGVNGRELAYKSAAKLSDTKWFFAVFAKTEVLSNFDFSYQPDRMQSPKHYIFHSKNPLNGLEYGSMNINLYNKDLVLNTIPGIDFTLSAPHEVVPILASISRFNTDPWVTWRSSFREVLKLKLEVETNPTVETEYRLETWCKVAEGENAEHCILGANDALNYYNLVNGNLKELMYSFDWEWLQNYYFSLYNNKPWLKSV